MKSFAFCTGLKVIKIFVFYIYYCILYITLRRMNLLYRTPIHESIRMNFLHFVKMIPRCRLKNYLSSWQE